METPLKEFKSAIQEFPGKMTKIYTDFLNVTILLKLIQYNIIY